ncbi:MAG: hypothetical protein DI498_09565 [Paracoccus denitrificans]|nr:MAG: hypothetical protein DI498_09565 [Paracoccus denitrificans]PZO83957.1 MAG: hypothetical protein DI633_09565 [Paracoccus denitrificans]
MADQDTVRLGLPLLQPAQAQKHVTVNEALGRLDGLVNLVVESTRRTTPPTVIEGECWAVPAGAVNAWEGRSGQIAIGANGGWVFAKPQAGQRAFVRDAGVPVIHDGRGFRGGALTMGQLGAGMNVRLSEVELSVGKGTTITTGLIVPANAMVIGCNARVSEKLGGTVKTWALGHTGATDRFGRGLGTGEGSYCTGLISPTSYYSPDPIIMTATDGAFDGGTVRIALHWLELVLPD